jgi:prepilin-type N-terminal cleavage/methylation domain-containing protein
MKAKKGFTLLEIIIVIVIIGILSTFGISQYIPARERALGKEATANLKLIAAAERIYRMENDTYYPASGTVNGVNNINTNLKLSLTTQSWHYSITGGTDTFTASASRNGSGGYLECIWSINETQEDPVVSTGPCLQ